MPATVHRKQSVQATAPTTGVAPAGVRSTASTAQSAAALAPRAAGRATAPQSAGVPVDAMVFPVVQDAVSLLLALRTQSKQESQKVQRGRVEDNREMQKALEAARKAALKAAQEAAEKAGFFGAILDVVKYVAVAAAAAATVATGGLGGVALAGAVMLLAADHVKDLLIELGVDPKVAAGIAVGLKLTGAIMMANAGALVSASSDAASLAGQLTLEALGNPPEWLQYAVMGIALAGAVASIFLGGGGSGAGEAAKATADATKKAADAMEKAAKIMEEIARAIAMTAKAVGGLSTIGQSVFQRIAEGHNLDAKEARTAYEAAMERMQDIIEDMKKSLKSMQRFEGAAVDAIAARNEAQAAAARNMA